MFTPAGLTIYEYETDDETQAALGRLVKQIDKPQISATGTVQPGGPNAEVVTVYDYRADGQMTRRQTIRGTQDPVASLPLITVTTSDADAAAFPAAPLGEEDRIELWTYASDNRLGSYTDARELTTTYTYDAHGRLETAVVTDQGVDNASSADDEVRSTKYFYDALGYPDRTEVYAGPVGTNRVSITDDDYNPAGWLILHRILAPNGTTELEKAGFEYAPDGLRTATVTWGEVYVAGLPTPTPYRSVSTYDKAGLLTTSVAAENATYFSVYSHQKEPIQQTTLYTYYADGSLKETTLVDAAPPTTPPGPPTGTRQTVYVDPLTRSQWTVTDHVSDGAHPIDPSTFAITFNLSGTRVLKKEELELGRKSRDTNLGTGGQVTQDITAPGLPALNQIIVGQPSQEVKSSTKYDARGNPLLQEFSDRGPQQTDYDEFGNAIQTANVANEQINASTKTNAAGDLIEQTEIEYSPVGFLADSVLPSLPSSWLSATYITTYQYDQQGRLRKTIDPLTDGDPAIPDEAGASPATVEYSFDVARNATKVTSTSRTGVSTAQWFDAAGRLVREENAPHGVTSYEYDLAGNLTAREFTPASSETLPVQRTTFQYDGLGRQRAVIQHGSEPSFTATDYFLPGADGADGWNVVRFVPLPGTDPSTYSDPHIKDLATRTRADSLGNVYFVQQPDPSSNPNDTPTTLITYSYLPELYATAVTTRLSAAENVGTSPPAIDLDNAGTRVTRQVTDANGNLILDAQRFSGFANSDALTVGTPDADGYSHFIDAGFIVLQRNEYHPATGQLSVVIDGKDVNGNDRVTTLSYFGDTGWLRSESAADGAVNYVQYTSFGARDGEMNQLGDFRKYGSDALGRRTIERDVANGTSQTIYAGNTIETHNPLGHVTQHIFDLAAGHMETRDALSGVTRISLDSAGNVTGRVDSLGHSTTYQYNSRNRLVKVTDASSGETVLGYDLAGNVVSRKDALQNEVQYEYDVLGRKIKETQPDPDGAGPLPAPVTRYQYDVAGNVAQQIRVIDPATSPATDRITAYEYDGLNRKIQETLPDPDGTGPLASPVIQYEYDIAGNVAKVIDPLGRETTYEYDILNRKIKETQPDPDGAGPLTAPVLQFQYDVAGHLVKEIDALGGEKLYEYDAFGRKTKETLPDPDGGGPLPAPVTQYKYDGAGNLTTLTQVIDSATSPTTDRVTVYEYDALGRKTKETLPDPDGSGPLLSSVTEFVYDAAGNLEKVIDPLGYETVYEYDVLGRKIQETLPDPDGSGPLASPVIQYQYDAVGNRTALTDPAGNTTTWVYDALNRVTEETNELGDTRYFVYDAAGNLARRTNRDGLIVEYEYDNLDRRIAERWLDALGATERTLNFAYDSASQLLAASDPDSTVTLAYDSLGRIMTANQTFPGLTDPVVLSSTYDLVGNRTQLAATLGGVADFVTDYAYDALNRMQRIEQHDAGLGGSPVAEKRIDLTYDAAGRPDLITRYADLAGTQLVAQTDYTFDLAGRLTALTHAQGTTTLPAYTWAYDDANRLTEFVSTTDGTATYTYDNVDQVTGATYTYQANETHAYEANGNRTGTGYATATNNRTTSDGTYTYEYDAEGNRTRRTEIATGAVTEYTWDHRNRLTAVTEPTSAADPVTARFEYTYDALNRRIAKSLDTDGDGTVDDRTFFVNDGLRESRDNAGDHVVLTLDAAGDVTHRFVYGPAVDQILADEQVDPSTSTSELLWPLTDNQGTNRDVAEFDAVTGITAIVNHGVYDAFGNVTSQTDPAVKTASGYTGGEFDEESGLLYRRARYYDAAIGQFVGEDPIGFEAGDANVRRYVGNNAANAADPSGLDEKGGSTSWWNYLPAAIAERRKKLAKEYDEYRETGQINDEFSAKMGFWKSAYFGGKDMLGAATEFGATVLDVGVGSIEVGHNAQAWVVNQFGADVKYWSLPQFSKGAAAINRHYSDGGAYADVALPAAAEVPVFVFSLGTSETIKGLAEYHDTGNPHAWREGATQQGIFAAGLYAAAPEGIMTPPELMPVEITPSPLVSGPNIASSSAVANLPQLAYMRQYVAAGRQAELWNALFDRANSSAWREGALQGNGGVTSVVVKPSGGHADLPNLQFAQPVAILESRLPQSCAMPKAANALIDQTGMSSLESPIYVTRGAIRTKAGEMQFQAPCDNCILTTELNHLNPVEMPYHYGDLPAGAYEPGAVSAFVPGRGWVLVKPGRGSAR